MRTQVSFYFSSGTVNPLSDSSFLPIHCPSSVLSCTQRNCISSSFLLSLFMSSRIILSARSSVSVVVDLEILQETRRYEDSISWRIVQPHTATRPDRRNTVIIPFLRRLPPYHPQHQTRIPIATNKRILTSQAIFFFCLSKRSDQQTNPLIMFSIDVLMIKQETFNWPP